MRFRIFIYLLAIIVSGSLRAQDALPADGVWTLRACVDYAIQNNLSLKRVNYSVVLSEIDKNQSKMAMLPTLNGNGNYGYNWGRSIDPSTNQFVEQRIESLNASLSSSLLLWNGFRLLYSYKQSETDWEATSEDQIKARNDLILNIASLYLNIVVNQELLKTAKSQVNSTEQQLVQTRRLAEAGSVPRSDVLNIEAQLATNELNVVQNENALVISVLRMKQALQLPGNQPFSVVVPEIPELGPFGLEITSEEVFNLAIDQMPEIKAARLRQQSALYSLRASRGNLYPRLSLNASLSTIYSDARREFIPSGDPVLVTTSQPIGYLPSTMETVLYSTYQTPGDFQVQPLRDQLKDNYGRSVGLNLNIPIFNGFTARYNVQRSAINRELADVSYKETENQLRQSVELAYTDALAAAKTFSASQKQVNARQEAFRLIEKRNEAGASTYIEYQISQNNLFQAESDLVRAKFDYFLKAKVLDFYQGKTIDF